MNCDSDFQDRQAEEFMEDRRAARVLVRNIVAIALISLLAGFYFEPYAPDWLSTVFGLLR